MATMRRGKKKISKVKIARIQVSILFMALILIGVMIGVFLGKITTKPQVEKETIIKTVEVPTYQKDKLPKDIEVTYFDVPLSKNLQKYIYEICSDEGVPVTLVMAMIEHESAFNAEVVSDTKDYGLMQINECNHSKLEESYRTADMLNPYQNVFCGVKIIGSYIREYNDFGKALMAYNMGDYGAKKAWENGISSSKYSTSILNLYEKYEEVLENAENADTF